MSIQGSVAFFLSPSGDLIHVPQNHISTLITDPERFGLTKEEIQTVYDMYGERIGVESAARKELLLKVITQGWIRIRRYPNKHWSITAPSLTPAVKEHLRDWAIGVLVGIEGFKEPDRYMPVRISTPDGEFHSTMGDLANGPSLW